MRPLARAASVVTAVVTTAALAVAPSAAEPPAPAEADTALTVRIVSPEPGETISGQQQVTVHVTADPGVTPHTTTVTIASLYDAQRQRSATTAVPDTCAPGCDITLTVDTISWIDPGPDPDAQDISLLDHFDYGDAFRGYGYGTVSASVDATTETGAPVTATTTLEQALGLDNPRPRLWPGPENVYTQPPQIGTGPLQISAVVTPYVDADLDRLEATLFGPGVQRQATFRGAPLDAHHQSQVTGTIPVADLPSGAYTLRLVAFDTAGRPSYVITRPVRRYRGPVVTVNRLIPQTPTGLNQLKGAVAELTVNVGPEWTPFEPERVDIYLDGDSGPAGTVEYFPWDQYLLDPDGNRTAMSVKVPLDIPAIANGLWYYSQPISAGSHTVKVVYTESTGRANPYGMPSTTTTTTTARVTAPGVTAATTVKGPVVQNASGTLAFTLTSRTGTNTPAAQIRSWKVAPFGGKAIASGTCTGTSCLSLTGSVPLKSLTGDYPTLIPSFHIVPVTLTYTDSAGITRTTILKVPVDPAIRTSVGAPASGTAGAASSVTIAVQQLNNVMLPGVPVTLQARTAGSSTWRNVATVKTGSTGTVRVPVTLKHNTYWRSVVPARAGWNAAATSAPVYTKVTAKVTASGLPTSGVSGRYYPVKATLSPVTTGRRVSVQVRRSGTSTWKTVTRPATNKYGRVATSVKFARGTWQVRVVADAITASAAGASKVLTIKVR